MEKVMQNSWNVIEFGFENCVRTLDCGKEIIPGVLNSSF